LKRCCSSDRTEQVDLLGDEETEAAAEEGKGEGEEGEGGWVSGRCPSYIGIRPCKIHSVYIHSASYREGCVCVHGKRWR
jgi:hypothetical protein